MSIATVLTRVFVFEQEEQTIRLADPNDQWTPQKVLEYYTPPYPILTSAKVSEGIIENDEWVFRFESTIGTKG